MNFMCENVCKRKKNKILMKIITINLIMKMYIIKDI